MRNENFYKLFHNIFVCGNIDQLIKTVWIFLPISFYPKNVKNAIIIKFFLAFDDFKNRGVLDGNLYIFVVRL
jgi:hypothetical protein